MKVTLVCPFSFGVTSTRLLQNLSKGLRENGFEVVFVSLFASDENVRALQPFGTVYTSHILNTMPRGSVVKDWLFNSISRELLHLFRKYRHELRNSVGMLVTSAFGGELALVESRREGIFLSIGWFYDNPPGILDFSSKLARIGRTQWENSAFDLLSSLTPLLSRHFRIVQDFDFVVASTRWVANVLYYMIGCEVDDVIYPPIDTEVFKHVPSRESVFGGKWCLSVGGKYEIRAQDIRNLTRKVAVVRAGQDPIDGAMNMGYASNEQLISLYSSAYLTLFPTLFEPAGYIPLESMACGTPVLTYAWQGPGETVKNNKTGWVVSTREEFSEMALRIWNEGYDPNIRKDCREYVIENFGVKKASEKLSKIIKKHC